MQLETVYGIGEYLPGLVKFCVVVVFQEIGDCSTGILDLLVTIAEGCEYDGVVWLDCKGAMMPVHDASYAMWVRSIAIEAISGDFIETSVGEGVRYPSGFGINEGFVTGIGKARSCDNVLTPTTPCTRKTRGVMGNRKILSESGHRSEQYGYERKDDHVEHDRGTTSLRFEGDDEVRK